MEAWGGSGGSWGSSRRHLGPKTAQSSKKLEKVISFAPPRGQVGSPFWYISVAKSPINGKKHEKTSSKNAPRKRSLSRRVQSVTFDYSYTLSAVLSGARGSQNGAKMEAKMEQNGIQGVEVASKIDFLRVPKYRQKNDWKRVLREKPGKAG